MVSPDTFWTNHICRGGITHYASVHIHTNNKFICTGELKVPTLLMPNPKVHRSTSNNPNFYRDTWTTSSNLNRAIAYAGDFSWLLSVHLAHCQDIYLTYTTAFSFKIVQLSLNAIKAENLSGSQNRPPIIVLPLSRRAKKLSRPILCNIHNSLFIHACYMSRPRLEFCPNRNTSFKLRIRENP